MEDSRAGFTLVEILVVVAIILILAALTMSAFVNLRRHEAVQRDTAAIVSMLETARSRTLASDNASGYGVSFDTASDVIKLFAGDAYSAGAVESTHTLHGTVSYDDITLSGGNDVVFERLSGATDNDGTVTLEQHNAEASSTIRIKPTGVIERQ